MKVAYLILAHKNPQQVKKLINSLNVLNAYFYIHIDKKVKLEDFTMLFDRNSGNINFAEIRENGQWGDIGIVKATLSLLKAAFADKCDYYILLSGMDYPIKSNTHIFSFLESHKEESFIEFAKLPVTNLNYGGFDRVEGYSYTIRNRRYTYIPYRLNPKYNTKGHLLNIILGAYSLIKGKRKKPNGINDFYYGSQWWMLNKDAVEYILEYLVQNPKYLQFHKFTLLPDEVFFQSILINGLSSNFLRIINNNYRFIYWNEDSNHPKFLDSNDKNMIFQSDSLFARKFAEDSDLYNIIDEKLRIC